MTEPQAKPDWKHSPDWARYLAMDSDKRWYWFEHEPKYNADGTWRVNVYQSKYQEANSSEAQDTLEERPEGYDVPR